MREQSALSGNTQTRTPPHRYIRVNTITQARARSENAHLVLGAQVAKNGLLCLQDMFRGLERSMDSEIKVIGRDVWMVIGWLVVCLLACLFACSDCYRWFVCFVGYLLVGYG